MEFAKRGVGSKCSRRGVDRRSEHGGPVIRAVSVYRPGSALRDGRRGDWFAFRLEKDIPDRGSSHGENILSGPIR
jgi:hypothetical protein